MDQKEQAACDAILETLAEGDLDADQIEALAAAYETIQSCAMNRQYLIIEQQKHAECMRVSKLHNPPNNPTQQS